MSDEPEKIVKGESMKELSAGNTAKLTQPRPNTLGPMHRPTLREKAVSKKVVNMIKKGPFHCSP